MNYPAEKNREGLKVGDRVRLIEAPQHTDPVEDFGWSLEGIVVEDSPVNGGVRVRHFGLDNEEEMSPYPLAWTYDEVRKVEHHYELSWGGWPLGDPEEPHDPE